MKDKVKTHKDLDVWKQSIQVETQLIIAIEIQYAKNDTILFQEIQNIQKMLNGLIKYIKNKG